MTDYVKYLNEQGLPGEADRDDCVAIMEKANAATTKSWTPPAK